MQNSSSGRDADYRIIQQASAQMATSLATLRRVHALRWLKPVRHPTSGRMGGMIREPIWLRYRAAETTSAGNGNNLGGNKKQRDPQRGASAHEPAFGFDQRASGPPPDARRIRSPE